MGGENAAGDGVEPAEVPRSPWVRRRQVLGLAALAAGAVYGMDAAASALSGHKAPPGLPQVPQVGTIAAPTDMDSVLAFNRDGTRLAVSRWNTVAVCEMATRTVLGSPTGELPQVATGVAFGPDGSLVVANTHTAQGGAAITRWDVDARKRLGAAQTPVTEALAMALRPDGGLLATIDAQGATTLWSMPDLRVVGSLPGTSDLGVHVSGGLAFSPDGARLLVPGGQGATATIWDVASRRLITPVNNGYHKDALWMAFTPDGRQVVVGDTSTSGSGGIAAAYLCSAVDGSLQSLLPDDRKQRSAHDVEAVPVAVSPNGRIVAFNLSTLIPADSPALALYDLATGRQVATADGTPTSCLAFSPDGRTLVGGGFSTSPDNPGVRVWDTSRWVDAPLPTPAVS